MEQSGAAASSSSLPPTVVNVPQLAGTSAQSVRGEQRLHRPDGCGDLRSCHPLSASEQRQLLARVLLDGQRLADAIGTEQERRDLAALRDRVRDELMRVVVVGKFSTGTLVNALLGAGVCRSGHERGACAGTRSLVIPPV